MDSKKVISLSSLSPLKQLFRPTIISSRNTFVSLDIGSAYIKAISLEKSGQNVNITGFSCDKIESDVKETVKKALSNFSMKKKELAISVSGPNVVLRYVNIPIMSHDEIKKSMAFELERYIPFKKEEINFDFTILKENNKIGKMLVLIAAVKKELVNSKVELCRDLGYSLNFVDVCPLAVANYFEFISHAKDTVCAVINLGATSTSTAIIEDGLLVLSRDIFIGGNDFTKKISETLNKDFKEAEELKLNSLDSNLIQSLEPVFSNLTKELKASFDFYETQENRLIDKIFVTGGSAKLQGLVEFFKHYLGQNIELINFNPDKFKLSPNLKSEELERDFNFFTFALGMAVRNF
ncbi:MAG: type IV pilus assembly protein PilM [Candidatus Omnitrophica bacterium]|nr:type IV pilus assembly protein PilM [Candidatus Omnitrophota bacterium]MDD5352735.1 type IV pilus assembly protein PilM [Candidatus Omnitrophota bacterium]MDD5550334.1 type IV pilus assembly protein PilM [Candidatus Omnitrophota bacterium]